MLTNGDTTAASRNCVAPRTAEAVPAARGAADNASAVGSEAWASGLNSTALGYYSTAFGDDSAALGSNAFANADNSVALGANSVADREGTVSVGSAGNERQITNVAAGTEGTDAVNLDQLKDATAEPDTSAPLRWLVRILGWFAPDHLL